MSPRALLALLLLAAAPAAALEPDVEPLYTGEPIDLDVRGARFADLATDLSMRQGLNVLVAAGAQDQRVDVSAEQVPWDEVMARVMKSAGIGSSFTGNVLVLAPLEELMAREPVTFCNAEMRSVALELRDEIETPELKCGLERVLGERGSVDLESVPGVLLMKAPSWRLEDAERWLEEHDAIDTTAADNDPRREALDAYLKRSRETYEQEQAKAAEDRKAFLATTALRARPLRRGLREAHPPVEPEGLLLASTQTPAPPEPDRDSPGVPIEDPPVDPEAPEPVTYEVVELGDDSPWVPPCQWVSSERPQLALRREDAASFIERLPDTTCDIEAVPEALAILESSELTGYVEDLMLDSLLRAIGTATGLDVVQLEQEGRISFVVDAP